MQWRASGHCALRRPGPFLLPRAKAMVPWNVHRKSDKLRVGCSECHTNGNTPGRSAITQPARSDAAYMARGCHLYYANGQ